jgi:hypothetical protein
LEENRWKNRKPLPHKWIPNPWDTIEKYLNGEKISDYELAWLVSSADHKIRDYLESQLPFDNPILLRIANKLKSPAGTYDILL